MYNKKKYGLKKLTALLIILIFAFCTLGNSVAYSNGLTEKSMSSSIGDTENASLNRSDVPELIEYDTALEKGHVERNRANEPDLYTVSFKNADKSETMYLFAEPVKYVDQNGEVKDKSTTLTLSGTDLIMADNDVNVRFSQKSSSGISITKDEYNISMTPVGVSSANRTAFQSAKNTYGNKVSYKNVFGTGTALEYTTIYTGVKEVIVLESYPENIKFTFIINTEGLSLVKQTNGAFSFKDPTTGQAVAEMTPVFCYDSAGNTAGGEIRISELKKNSEYSVTIIPEENFLASKSTVYPVYVDPTITMNTNSAIEDAVIYSGMPNNNFGSFYFNTVGYSDDGYGKGTLLIKFPTLANNNTFAQTHLGDITSAELSLYTGGGGNAASIKVFSMSSAWDESTITWNSFSSTPIITQHITTSTVPTGAMAKTTFDLLPLVRMWKKGTFSPANGIILNNANINDASHKRTFVSTEYALNNNLASMPCLVITYSNWLEPQQTSVWCWVASARMVSFAKMNSDVSQSSATVWAKLGIETSNPTNAQILNATDGGTVQETEAALEYILHDEYDIYSSSFGIYTEPVLQGILDTGAPIEIHRGFYYGSVRDGGHAVMIRDYYYDIVLLDYVYIIYDPWAVNVGSIYELTYDELVDERNSLNNGYVWESVITYREGAYNNITQSPAYTLLFDY